MSASADRFLALSERVRVLPIIHGSGDFAIRVREAMLARTPDCLAVPLPPSFQEQVEAAVAELPAIRAVVRASPVLASVAMRSSTLTRSRRVSSSRRVASSSARLPASPRGTMVSQPSSSETIPARARAVCTIPHITIATRATMAQLLITRCP